MNQVVYANNVKPISRYHFFKFINKQFWAFVQSDEPHEGEPYLPLEEWRMLDGTIYCISARSYTSTEAMEILLRRRSENLVKPQLYKVSKIIRGVEMMLFTIHKDWMVENQVSMPLFGNKKPHEEIIFQDYTTGMTVKDSYANLPETFDDLKFLLFFKLDIDPVKIKETESFFEPVAMKHCHCVFVK